MKNKIVTIFVWVLLPIGLPLFFIGMITKFLSGYFVVGWRFFCEK